MGATWSIALGILIFAIAGIVAIYFYTKERLLSYLFFIASIATYIFAVFYTWDVFELENESVLLILAVSVLLMFFLGHYFSKVSFKEERKRVNGEKTKK